MPTLGRGPERPRAAVLVVEDDPDIRDVTYRALRAEGYRVVAVTNHADALTLLSAVRFALILSDSTGPETQHRDDRWADLDALRQAAGNTPTLIFSAHRASVFRDYAARGFAGFITKPFDLDKLVATVRRHVC